MVKTILRFPELYGTNVSMTNPNLVYVLDNRLSSANNPLLDLVEGNSGAGSSSRVMTVLPKRGDMCYLMRSQPSLVTGFNTMNVEMSALNNGVYESLTLKYYLILMNKMIQYQGSQLPLETYYNQSTLIPLTSTKMSRSMRQGHHAHTYVSGTNYYHALHRYMTIESYGRDVSTMSVHIHNPFSTGVVLDYMYIVYTPFLIVPTWQIEGRKGVTCLIKGYINAPTPVLYIEHNNSIVRLNGAGYMSTDKTLKVVYDNSSTIYRFTLVLREDTYLKSHSAYGVITSLVMDEP
ncbi:MAG: hypothetical protein NZ888_05130 [Candidatus Nitrosocaldus sp.]|nr:hypothetical protein [Candidatus Nitrosocaldus sp.]MDW8000331.1 hypothetical protein [Candidatus Nitrosocaldus sp.]